MVTLVAPLSYSSEVHRVDVYSAVSKAGDQEPKVQTVTRSAD